jgi:hypothetical protein
MQHPFSSILATAGVKGTILLSIYGDILFERFTSPIEGAAGGMDWKPLVGAFAQIHEADIIFDELRIYLRKAEPGYLLVFTEASAPMAMVRLNADLLLPALKNRTAPKGLKRFFKSKK